MSIKTVRAIVALIGLYIAAQLIADVAATKFVEVFGIVMPAGTFVFALTFTLRDMVHKRLGREWARAAIVMAAACNVLLAAYMATMARLPAPAFYPFAEAWSGIFAIVPAITIGSIVAELVSELTDTEIYHLVKTRTKAPQWVRVLASNVISLPLDSVMFTLFAFVLLPPLFGADAMPLGSAVARIASGQILFKAVVAIASIPFIYAVKDQPLDEVVVE